MNKQTVIIVAFAVAIVTIAALAPRLYISVPAGHVAVATLFGKVKADPYPEGLHLPVNPLYEFVLYDIREKEHKETAGVPSQDQLTTSVDVSIKYRINAEDAPRILQETGDFNAALQVQIIPKLRSVVREQGKSLARAEDFFLQETQEQLQSAIFNTMSDYLQPKGITCLDILIRDIKLPNFITRAIESKKEREQEVENQKAELERFRTEQQQIIAEAQANREAAELEAEQRRVLADAQAYEIEKLNEAIAQNPAYIQLQALEALKAISADDSSKLYFINGDSPAPLPLMNMGEPLIGK